MKYMNLAFIFVLVFVMMMIAYNFHQTVAAVEPFERFRRNGEKHLMFNGSFHHDPVMCLGAGNKQIPCTAFSTA